MIIVQLTGLSGAGKTSLAQEVQKELVNRNYSVELIDGDDYRRTLCKDLGFSEQDRKENITRLGFVAEKLAKHNIIVIIAAINPFESSRTELSQKYNNVKTIWIKCSLETLIKRDTKGLYRRALLDAAHKDKLMNLSGVNDVYEEPLHADLTIETDNESIDVSAKRLIGFIVEAIKQKDR
jgi:adenylylsulfate kinase